MYTIRLVGAIINWVSSPCKNHGIYEYIISSVHRPLLLVCIDDHSIMLIVVVLVILVVLVALVVVVILVVVVVMV